MKTVRHLLTLAVLLLALLPAKPALGEVDPPQTTLFVTPTPVPTATPLPTPTSSSRATPIILNLIPSVAAVVVLLIAAVWLHRQAFSKQA